MFTEPDLVADVEAFVQTHAHENVYFGVAARVEKNGTLSGDLEHCGTVHALWADVDFKQTPEPEARALLTLCPTPPSIIIHSGGGLHVYWLLRDALAADAALKGWLRRLARTFKADMASAEPARVLRLPGTTNHKPDYPEPRPVTLELFEPSRRYALADLAWLPNSEPTQSGTPAPRPTPEWLAVLGGVGEGHRQAELPRVVGLLYAKLEPALARTLAHSFGRGCEPPLTETEVDGCCDRIERKELAKGTRAKPPAAAPVVRRRLVPVSDVVMRPVPWLWPGYLPRGAVTLVVGDPDCGKTLTTLDIAARVSAGRAFPDGVPRSNAQPGNVVVLSAEDSPAYTIRPRLEAAEADNTRVSVLSADLGSSGLSLADDVEWLSAALESVGAQLAIIDPVSAYMPRIDTYRDNEVRVALAPLVALAEQSGVAVVGVIHMSKNVDRTAMQRVLGSTAFTALSRAAYMVAKDPDDDARRLVLPVKFNLGRRPPGLAFTPTATMVRTPEGLSIESVRAVWDPATVSVGADEVLRRQQARAGTPGVEAERVIREALAVGPMLAKDVEALAAKAGASERTVNRARERLGVESIRDPQNTMAGGYFWLPPKWGQEPRMAWIASRRALRHE